MAAVLIRNIVLSEILMLIVIMSIISPLYATEIVPIATDEYEPYTSSAYGGSGVVLEIVRESFVLQGIEVEYQFYPWKRGELLVNVGEVYGTVPYFRTQERSQKYDFSEPLIYSINRFFYNKQRFPDGFVWSSYDDFRGYVIGGTLGYWYISAFERAGLKVEEVRTDKQNLKKLIKQRVDFVLMDELTGLRLLRECYPDDIGKIDVLAKPESFLEFHVMVSRNYPNSMELTKLFNQGLKELKENGQYRKILKKYHIHESFAVP